MCRILIYGIRSHEGTWNPNRASPIIWIIVLLERGVYQLDNSFRGGYTCSAVFLNTLRTATLRCKSAKAYCKP